LLRVAETNGLYIIKNKIEEKSFSSFDQVLTIKP